MKMPAVFKGLNKDEAVALATEREKDIKKKSGMRLASLVETHKQQKSLMALGTVIGSAAMEGAAHASETVKKWDPLIGAVVGGAGLGLAVAAEDETLASVSLASSAVGFSRTANWLVRMGVDKVKEMRAEKAA